MVQYQLRGQNRRTGGRRRLADHATPGATPIARDFGVPHPSSFLRRVGFDDVSL
jgi:hypothetical protein